MMVMTRIMTFADASPVVYAESLHSGQLIDYPALVKQYRESYDLLRAVALSPEASLTMIEAAAETFEMASHEIDSSAAKWRKTSYSNGTGGDCVEVAPGVPEVIPVRDSKSQTGPVLLFPAKAWPPFLSTLKHQPPSQA